MVKININSTNFIKNDTDLVHKDIVTIANEGGWEVSERFKKEDGTPQNTFKINLKLKNGEIRSATLSFANLKLLAIGLGEESSSWVGKEVRAWKTKSERAKLGYTYIYVPIDWTRDDMGEWNDAQGKPITLEKKEDVIQVSQEINEEINPEDIPF